MIPLREYQRQAIEQVRARIATGIKRLVLVLATGGGKTIVASHIIASAIAKDTRCLFLARRREIIKQTFCKLVRNGIIPQDIGIIMAGVTAGPADVRVDLSLSDNDLWTRYARRRPGALVQVASLDTLRSRAKSDWRLIIADECHGALAKGFVDLLSCFPSACVLGLTATPYRGDNRGLGEDVTFTFPDGTTEVRPLFQDLVTVASPKQLIREGYLVEPRVWTVPDSALPDISRVKIRGGDYDPEALSAAVDRDVLVGSVVDHWERRAKGVRTVVFPVSVAHSRHVVERFIAAGHPAEHLDGTTPTADRDAILARLESGETLIVSSVGVLCEGWDQPSVKCCALLRPTRSTGLYLQMAGRILRPWRGQEAIILDHAGLTLDPDHGFVTQDREFMLEAKSKKRGLTSAPAKSCPECWAVIASSLIECPNCGHAFGGDGTPRGMPEEAEGDLVEVVAPSDDDLRSAWVEIVQECVQKGYAPGWCHIRFGEKYPGQRRPDGCEVPSAEECSKATGERLATLDRYMQEAILHGRKAGWAKSSYKARTGQWPSYDLFIKTTAADAVRGLLAGLGAVLRLAKMRVPQPVVEQTVEPVPPQPKQAQPVQPVANDVEMVDYLIGA